MWSIFYDCLLCVLFDMLELLKLLLVGFIDILEVLLGHDALEALVDAKLASVECCWSVMKRTVDSKGTLGEFLLHINLECIINYMNGLFYKFM